LICREIILLAAVDVPALPPLQLKSPSFGYNLGSWSEEDAADAARAVRGEHCRTGELREQQRVRLEKTEKR
jgi:hypothetical protein